MLSNRKNLEVHRGNEISLSLQDAFLASRPNSPQLETPHTDTLFKGPTWLTNYLVFFKVRLIPQYGVWAVHTGSCDSKDRLVWYPVWGEKREKKDERQQCLATIEFITVSRKSFILFFRQQDSQPAAHEQTRSPILVCTFHELQSTHFPGRLWMQAGIGPSAW